MVTKNLLTIIDVIITPSDKGCGIVIMDTNACNEKLESILDYDNIYTKRNKKSKHRDKKMFIKTGN